MLYSIKYDYKNYNFEGNMNTNTLIKFTLLILILVLSDKLTAQNKKETYQFSKDIQTKIESDTLPWRFQLGATDFSISEHYTKALETWDKNGGGTRKIDTDDSVYFYSFQAQNAAEYIINRSKYEKIIIINEAHHNSRHRVFSTTLLEGLYNNGYRFLGLEALSDSLINIRKFPTQESGYYTKEPQMANLIYEALKIGFTLFEYEPNDQSNGKQREIGQAENIAKLMKEHPEDKFFIHCGYDHVIEGTPGNKNWEKAMAGRLKEFTGIDPFTIDQVAFSEKSNPNYNSGYIAMTNENKPMILVAENGKTFNGSATNDQTDCKIIHPFTQFVNGRENWLNANDKRKPYPIPIHKIKTFPVLVLAYRMNEMEQNGVPADIIEIWNKESISNLVLARGDYKIIVKDKEYKVIQEWQAKVK